MSEGHELEPEPDPVPSFWEVTNLLQHFRFSEEELRQAGLEEKDFRLMLARLRLLVLNDGWILED